MKMNWKETGKDLMYDFFGALLQALGTWCFIEPCRIAPGGVSGIALLINFITGFPVGVMTFVLNVPLLISAWLLLNRKIAVKTIQTVVIMKHKRHQKKAHLIQRRQICIRMLLCKAA